MKKLRLTEREVIICESLSACFSALNVFGDLTLHGVKYGVRQLKVRLREVRPGIFFRQIYFFVDYYTPFHPLKNYIAFIIINYLQTLTKI